MAKAGSSTLNTTENIGLKFGASFLLCEKVDSTEILGVEEGQLKSEIIITGTKAAVVYDIVEGREVARWMCPPRRIFTCPVVFSKQHEVYLGVADKLHLIWWDRSGTPSQTPEKADTFDKEVRKIVSNQGEDIVVVFLNSQISVYTFKSSFVKKKYDVGKTAPSHRIVLDATAMVKNNHVFVLYATGVERLGRDNQKREDIWFVVRDVTELKPSLTDRLQREPDKLGEVNEVIHDHTVTSWCFLSPRGNPVYMDHKEKVWENTMNRGLPNEIHSIYPGSVDGAIVRHVKEDWIVLSYKGVGQGPEFRLLNTQTPISTLEKKCDFDLPSEVFVAGSNIICIAGKDLMIVHVVTEWEHRPSKHKTANICSHCDVYFTSIDTFTSHKNCLDCSGRTHKRKPQSLGDI